MSNAGLADAANALEADAAGVEPNRAELISGALALNILVDRKLADRKPVSTNLQLAALGLEVQATASKYGIRAYLNEGGRRHAGKLAEAVRELLEE
jgi:hypothetical protein